MHAGGLAHRQLQQFVGVQLALGPGIGEGDKLGQDHRDLAQERAAKAFGGACEVDAGEEQDLASWYFPSSRAILEEAGLSGGDVRLDGPRPGIDALYLPGGGRGGTVLGGLELHQLDTLHDASAPFGALALLAHEGYPGHALEFDLFSDPRVRPWRLMRDRTLSEGWASLAEHFPICLTGVPSLARATEAVIRRCMALLLRADPSHARSLARGLLPHEAADTVLNRAERTRTDQRPYIVGFARWRTLLHYDYQPDFNWQDAIRTAGRPENFLRDDPLMRGDQHDRDT